jgi:hypothetical protein
LSADPGLLRIVLAEIDSARHRYSALMSSTDSPTVERVGPIECVTVGDVPVDLGETPSTHREPAQSRNPRGETLHRAPSTACRAAAR